MKTCLFVCLSIFTTCFSLMAQEPYIIDLKNPITEEIPLYKLFTEPKHVELFGMPTSIRNVATYYLSDEYIIVCNFTNVYLFDRESGEFVRELSRQGHGENEYAYIPVPQCAYDEENNLFFFNDRYSWKAINVKTGRAESNIGKPKESISLPNSENSSGQAQYLSDAEQGWKQGIIGNPWPIGNGKYAGYVNNPTGKVNVLLVIFDEKGKVIKAYPNKRTYDKKRQSIGQPANPGQFYSFKGENYFKESFFNDTIFHVTGEALVPHVIFDMGEHSIPYEALGYETYESNEIYYITFVFETESYIFFNYSSYNSICEKTFYCGYYDKKERKTYTCKEHDLKGGYSGIIESDNFIPRFINKTGEVIGISEYGSQSVLISTIK